MPDRPYREWLRQPGNQARLGRFVERVTGRTMSQATLSKWARDRQEPWPAAEALIEIVRQHPELMEIER